MSDDWLDALAVGAGGAIGAVLRFLAGRLAPNLPGSLPLTTLLVNVVGAFVIGLVLAGTGRRAHVDPRMVLFLTVGFAGGFTTFSTFSHETFRLLQDGKVIHSLAYVVLSVTLCLLAIVLAERLVG